MGSTKKTGKGRFVPRAEIKNDDRRMRREEAKNEIINELLDLTRLGKDVDKVITNIMDICGKIGDEEE
tara:strand:+ start:647 stop:850 length:204 start_codon:yes stop_codon:yes gene_type:complete